MTALAKSNALSLLARCVAGVVWVTGGGGSSAASHKRPSTLVFKRRKRPVAGKDKKDKPTSFGAIQFDPSSVTQPGEGAHVETRSFGV